CAGSRKVSECRETLRTVRLECAAMKCLGSGLGRGQNSAAAALTILCGKGSRQYLKLFSGVWCRNKTVGAINAHIAGQAINNNWIRDWPSAAQTEIVDVGIILTRTAHASERLGNEKLIRSLRACALREVDKFTVTELATNLRVRGVE